MRRAVFTLGFCIVLSGCTKVQDTSSRTLDNVERETASSWQRVREYLDISSKPPVKEKSRVQPRYCYSAYHDVICYSSPVAGQEDRLLAYQNSAGTGYTIAPVQLHGAHKKVKMSKKHEIKDAAKASSATTPADTATPKEAVLTQDGFGVAPTNTMEKNPSGLVDMQNQIDKYGPQLPSTPAPVVAAPVSVPTKAAAETKKLKEITFDPSELEPKKLVPDRIQ